MKVEGAISLIQTNGNDDAAKLLAELSLGDLRSLHGEAGCDPTKSPNRVYLARQVVAALAPRAAAKPEPTPEPEKRDDEGEPAAKQKREKLPVKTVDELRAEYLDVVGRPTDSTDAGYLKWKIREARKGNIRVGAIERGSSEPRDEMVLPIRMDRALVEKLDAHWKAEGYKSRMAFIRNALATLIGNEGNDGLAALIGVSSSTESTEDHAA